MVERQEMRPFPIKQEAGLFSGGPSFHKSGGSSCLFSTLFVFLNIFIYLFMRDTERKKEAETQAKGEAGSMQGARCRA